MDIEKMFQWLQNSLIMCNSLQYITTPLKDQSSSLQSYEKMIYSENSRKMEHFFLLRYSLKKFQFRDIRV